MNEIEMLRKYGPDAPELSEEAMTAARSRLLAEVSATATSRSRLGRRLRWFFAAAGGGRASSGRRQIVTRLTVAVAGATALAAITVLSLVGTASSPPGRPPATATGAGPAAPGQIRLVAATALEFPYALPSLGTPTFTADPGGPIMAIYQDPDHNDVVLTIGSQRQSRRIRGERSITVDGRPGRLLTVEGRDDSNGTVQLTWERQPGGWVTIVGNGRYASEAAVLRLAREVVDQPRPVTLKIKIGLVPAGWELGGFKSGGSIMTYRDPAAPDRTLSAQWTPGPPNSSDAEVEGFEGSEPVIVDGRGGHLVRAAEFWRLTTTLPDGSGLMMLAPRDFTTEQVIAIAGSVRVDGE